MIPVKDIEMALIRPGFTKMINFVDFVYEGDRIEVYVDYVLADEIDCIDSDGLPSVNTEYDFDMQCMFWLREYNMI